MLVLSRKKNEEIIISHPEGNLVLSVVELRGDKVRLGISAPDSVEVHRREVWEAKYGRDSAPASGLCPEGTINLPGTDIDGLPCILLKSGPMLLVEIKLPDVIQNGQRYELRPGSFRPNPTTEAPANDPNTSGKTEES